MGVHAQSQMRAVLPGALGYRGIALPSAMFALVAVSILAAGVFAFADLSAKATLNQERSTRAMQVADAGLSHAVSLLRGQLRMHSFTRILRGSDNFIPTADDSLFINYGLAANDQIPLAGKAFQGHTYFVGATAEVSAIVGAVPQPGFAADGNAAFAGGPDILGPCGGAHANGNISSSGGGPTVATQVSATGTVTGNWNLPDNTNAPKVPNAAPIDIPDLNPADYCGADADFRLLPGGVAQNGAGVGIAVPLGWAYNAGTLTWTATGAVGVPAAGTYCVTGNAYVQGSVGTSALPAAISVIATGSIRIEGTPYMRADHPDGILALAGGDLYLAGNAAAGAISYSGMLYARA
ncbi:MAG: hypothetical protein K0S19_2028, partial [Geminicoccaceae bacterium]|nr:hypothetical protein [Geminicoccaceae bacterium]